MVFGGLTRSPSGDPREQAPGYGPGMRYRPLGDSGLVVSVVGLGGNNFGRRIDLDGTRAVVDAAIDAGITLVDTADIYGNKGGSEALLGEVLKGRRREVVLATKFGMDMGGANGPDWGARIAPLHPARGRSFADAAADRLDRPLPVPRARRHHAAGGDRRRARRARARREGALHRVVEPRRLAGGRLPRRSHAATAGAATSARRTRTACSIVWPSASWCRRACTTASGSCPTSRSRTACSPASTAAVRRRRRGRGSRRAAAPSATGSSTSSTRSSSSRGSGASRCSTSRSADSRRNRRSAR